MGDCGKASLGASLLILTVAANEARSQVAAPQQEAGLGEVVVTAQRRSESLQKVPIAVTALDSAALESVGIQRTEDLTKVVPGLQMAQGGTSWIAYVRGVGTVNASTIGQETAIALYVDDVYMVDTFGGLSSLGTVERVEVLKGPQGTLFGRNATGGLIHIITPDPQAAPLLRAKVGYESYDTVLGSIYATGALTSSLEANLSVDVHHQGEGFGRDVNTGQEANFSRNTMLRGKLLWEPTEDDRVTFTGDYLEDNSDFSEHVGILQNTIAMFGGEYSGSIYNTAVSHVVHPTGQNWGASLKWEHAFSNDISLKSVSAYRDVEGNLDHIDYDFSPADVQDVYARKKTRSFQQEVLVQGNVGHRLDYTGGVFFLADQQSYPINLHVLPGTPSQSLIDLLPKSRLVSYSAYGQADYHLTDADTLTAGLRYTVDRQHMHGTNAQDGVVYLAADDRQTFDKPTWRAAYEHQLTVDLMAYVSNSRGFRSGVFNGFDLNSPAVQPEVIDAFEGGFKGEFLDKHLQLGLNGFHYEYKNLQLNRFTLLGTSVLQNVGKMEIYGGELESVALLPVPVGNLRLGANLSLMHPEITEFQRCGIITPNFPAAGNTVIIDNCSGHTAPYAPKIQLNLSADYTVPVGGRGGRLGLTVNYYHSSRVYFDPDNVASQKPHDFVDAEISYALPDDRTHVRVYGRNLTDAQVLQRVDRTPLGFFTSAKPPRILGVGLEYSLN